LAELLVSAVQICASLFNLGHKIAPIKNVLLGQQVIDEKLLPQRAGKIRIGAQPCNQLIQLARRQARAVLKITVHQQIKVGHYLLQLGVYESINSQLVGSQDDPSIAKLFPMHAFKAVRIRNSAIRTASAVDWSRSAIWWLGSSSSYRKASSRWL